MVHTLLDLLEYWRTGVCRVHGASSQECDAANELYTIGSSALVGAAIGAYLGGRAGLVFGLLGGGVLGKAVVDGGLPELPAGPASGKQLYGVRR